MMGRAWEWIEAILMFIGFLYMITIIAIFFVLMLPIFILFERTDKSIRKSNVQS